MVKLWCSNENIFHLDETSVCPYQLSYQHPDINTFLQALITDSSALKSYPEMNQWYRKVNNSNTVYDSKVKHDKCKDRNLEEFFNQSILLADNALSFVSTPFIALLHALSFASPPFIDLLHGAMTEFSNTMAKNKKYAHLEYKAVISGSLREQTKTFVPCEGDVTCVAIYTQGLEIINNTDSQTAIKVNPEIAKNNWSRLCIGQNFLCPKHLQSEFCDAMEYALENTDPELIRPFF